MCGIDNKRVHIFKGDYKGKKILDRKGVNKITTFLLDHGVDADPERLITNQNKSFIGSVVLGMGFTFDDSVQADDDSEGIPSPISTMKKLISENNINEEVIFPYIGGEEVNNSSKHESHRYVIFFGDRSEDECRKTWPELMEIIEKKVKPARLKQKREIRSRYWGLWREHQPYITPLRKRENSCSFKS